MVGRDQQGAHHEESEDGADHVHQAVIAGSLRTLVGGHLVREHALVGPLSGVGRHLEEDVDDQERPVGRDERDQGEEDDVAHNADRDERPAPPESKSAVVTEGADRRLPHDGERRTDGIEQRDVCVDIQWDCQWSEDERRRRGKAGDEEGDDVAPRRLNAIGDSEPEAAQHEHAPPGDPIPDSRLRQRPQPAGLRREAGARHGAESNSDPADLLRYGRMGRSKITVVGAGNVGATLAQRLAERGYADIVLVDIVEGLPQGKALDMLQAGPIVGYDSRVTGTNGYDETAGSAICVITSGVPRKPGMSRDDLVKTNMGIVRGVTEELVRRSPDATLIVVSNPLDAMAQLALEVSKFPRQRVIGMAGVLDTARFRTFIALELNVSVHDVQAYVLGGHGDTMVPLARMCTVAGVPITKLIKPDRIEAIVKRTRDGGAEIVNLLKSGSAYYAPSAAVAEMVDAIMLDRKQILPCAVRLEGEYGIRGLFVGVPVKLGAGGAEEIIELDLTDVARNSLRRSAASVKELVGVMGI